MGGGRAGSASQTQPLAVHLLLSKTLVLNVPVMTAGSGDQGITISHGNTMEVPGQCPGTPGILWDCLEVQEIPIYPQLCKEGWEEAQPRGPGPGFHNLMYRGTKGAYLDPGLG